jgi:hypothetical protein
VSKSLAEMKTARMWFISCLRSQYWLEWVSCVSHRRFGLGTVMVSSDLIYRFGRRGSMVRKCVKGVNCG